MSATAGCTAQIKIPVEDVEEAIAFYRDALGKRYEVARRSEDGDHSSFRFGTYGPADSSLLHLKADPTEADRPAPTTFGLLVDDLDVFHGRALSAGGTEVSPPHGLFRACSAGPLPGDRGSQRQLHVTVRGVGLAAEPCSGDPADEGILSPRWVMRSAISGSRGT